MVGNLKAKHKEILVKVGNLKSKTAWGKCFSLCPLLSLDNPNPLAFIWVHLIVPYLTMNLPITLSLSNF